MKTLYFESNATIKFDVPVQNHQFLLKFIPQSFAGQNVLSANLNIFPSVNYNSAIDSFGNLCLTGCVDFPHDTFSYCVSGIATVCESAREKEVLMPIYKFPSQYTKPSEKMKEFLHGLNLSGNDFEKSLAIASGVFDHMTYTKYSTTTKTTASEAFELGKGVCQDYSHIFISLSRLAGIPCRYANGLQLGEGQSHAWVEVYVDGKWIGIDPTQNRIARDDYIRFCVGRDFGDGALERGTFIGRAFQTQTSFAQVYEK